VAGWSVAGTITVIVVLLIMRHLRSSLLVSVLLPLGDGVGLAAKTSPLVTELGGPF